MLNKRIEEAINAQINAEFWSAYLYLSMSTYFEAEGKSGFANWFRVQFKEEQAHAEILMNYVQDRGGRVELRAIEAVPTTWNSALDAFEATLAHENKVTALLNNLYAIAEEEKDYATRSMLTWFRHLHARQRTCRPRVQHTGSARQQIIRRHRAKHEKQDSNRFGVLLFFTIPHKKTTPILSHSIGVAIFISEV